MIESKYKLVRIYQNGSTNQRETDKNNEEYSESVDDNDAVTIMLASDYQHELAESVNIQKPATILSLILIYFILSIGLTFYQRSLLKVCS